MNDLENQIRRTFDAACDELVLTPRVKDEVFEQLEQLERIPLPYSMMIRIPVVVSFFTTIMSVPIAVY
ncbi:MAG TPA: hypothetical protein VJ824_16055 [Bacillota bacterium]|nr:hypothetical protein [Bacillota bacterium]